MTVSLLDAFRECARLLEVPNTLDDPEGAANAEKLNARRRLIANILVKELTDLSRRTIRAGDRWQQRDCANSVVAISFDNLCGETPRGIRATDPDTDDGVRAYLRTVLRHAFIGCLGANGDTHPEEEEYDDDRWLADETDEDDPAHRSQAFIEIFNLIENLSLSSQLYIAECMTRRQAELALGRTRASAESVLALKSVWESQIMAHAYEKELDELKIAFRSPDWQSHFDRLSESVRSPAKSPVVYFDDPPRPVTAVQKAVMNRMAQRQGRAMQEILDAVVTYIRAQSLDYSEASVIVRELYSRVPGRKGTIAHTLIRTTRKQSVRTGNVSSDNR